MKKFIAISISLITSLLCFGQHVLYLKSGEKLTGEVQGGKKDTVYFSFYGNKLKIAHENITAIYFSKEIEVIATPAPAPSSQTQTIATPPQNVVTEVSAQTNNEIQESAPQTDGTIRGVITYYLTKTNVTKPDVGARVVIVDSASVPDFDITVVDTFHFGNSYREIYNQYKLNHARVPRDIPEQMMLWKSDTKTTFELLSRRAYKNINILKKAPSSIKTSTDDKGQFNVNVKPGTYYVYVVSNYANGDTIIDMDGKVHCKKVQVKSNDESFVRNSFDVF